MSDPHGGPADDPGDELVEVVDPDGDVVEVVTRRMMRAGRLRHRATYIAVLDAGGRLLVHRRSPTKDVWPSRWDVAAGGVVGVGEPWDVAAARELSEELGLVAELHDLGPGSFEDTDVATVGRVYSVTLPDSRVHEIDFADGEVVEARWVASDELRDLLAAETFCPDSLAIVLPLIDMV